jgi:hypothetical protein
VTDPDRLTFFRALVGDETPPPDLQLPVHKHVERIPAADPVAEAFDASDQQRTTRWTDDEFLLVDGLRCVYLATERDGITIVFMPGGRRALLSSLRLVADVVLPRRIRYGA